MKDFDVDSSSILCIGNSWFPSVPGGLNRYVYELTHCLAAGQDQVELCGIGLPETPISSPVKLANLAELDNPPLQRLWSAHFNFLNRKLIKPDAVNLHFALNCLPLMTNLPQGVPWTFTFHGPWALESEREGSSKLSVSLKHWVEKRVYQRCDRFIVLSQDSRNFLVMDT